MDIHRLHRCVGATLLALLLQACTSVPFDYPRSATFAPPPDPDTLLGAAAERWTAEHPGYSGFFGMGNGMDALGARLKMMEAAERTIDAQYFLIKPDRAGALFAGKLLLAADRGVRVRLLLDDIFTTVDDRAIALLDGHPNIEVRLFNPMSRQSFKYWTYLMDFKRANRRMHNKSFTVDSALTIVGGRNIAEEYFDLNSEVQFDDFEVLAIGPVVEEVSNGFDLFWNSELSVPMTAFEIDIDPEELQAWREYMAREMRESETGLYSRAVNSTLITEIRENRRDPAISRAVMVTDSPDKASGAVGDAALAELAVEIGRRFYAADNEIMIITPYFVPGEKGLASLKEILNRGTRVVIITNSLASTNHVPVHSGYARYRKSLLEAGAEIYEIRVNAVRVDENAVERPETLTLHSKATIIDRDTVFVGSLNFDPRSVLHNTEMGLFIESEEVGRGLYEAVRDSLGKATYRVTLDDNGDLLWRRTDQPDAQALRKEPQASWSRRFMAGLYGLLPIESQL